MSQDTHYFKIGIFVIAATIIFVIATIVLGAGALFRKTILVETYFDESVQGLDIGSPVKYRGIPIGKVTTINSVEQIYGVDCRYVIVRCELYCEAFGKEGAKKYFEEYLQDDIRNGLRVRLASLGLTGSVFVEADFFDPNRFPALEISWNPQHPHVPSAPNMITRLSESLDRILKNLEQINIVGITTGLEKTIASLNEVMKGAKLEGISTEATKLLSEIRETNRNLGNIVSSPKTKTMITEATNTVATANRIIAQLEKPIAQLEKTLLKIDHLIMTNQEDIEIAIDNIRIISENLEYLTENSKRYPSQLFFGNPPPATNGENYPK